MRDPFDDTPVLRLGASSHKITQAPDKAIATFETVVERGDPLRVDTDKLTMVEVEVPSPVVVVVEGGARVYSFKDVEISIAGRDQDGMIVGSVSDGEIRIGVDRGVDDRTVAALFGTPAHETRGRPAMIVSDVELERFARLVCESVAREHGIPARLLLGPKDPITATQKVELDRFYDRFQMPALEDGMVRYEPAPPLDPLTLACREVEPEVLSEEEFARRYPDRISMMVYDEAAPVPREAFNYLARRTIDHRPMGMTEEEWRTQLRKNHDALVKKDPQP